MVAGLGSSGCFPSPSEPDQKMNINMWILSGTGCLSHLSPLAEVDVEGGVELHHMILLPLIPDEDFFSKNGLQGAH